MLTEPTLCLLPQERAAVAPASLLFHTLGPASLWPLGAGMGFSLVFSDHSLFRDCVCWVQGRKMQAGEGYIPLGRIQTEEK